MFFLKSSLILAPKAEIGVEVLILMNFGYKINSDNYKVQCQYLGVFFD